jgi:hypothetical protein
MNPETQAFLWGFVVGAAVTVIAMIAMATPPDGPMESTAKNFVETHKAKTPYMNWLPGANQQERVLWRMNTTRAFKFTDYTGSQHILSDPQWRRAKHELLQAGILEVAAGRTATLSETGSLWLENVLYGNKQTEPTNPVQVGEGADPAGLTDNFRPIDRAKMMRVMERKNVNRL